MPIVSLQQIILEGEVIFLYLHCRFKHRKNVRFVNNNNSTEAKKSQK